MKSVRRISNVFRTYFYYYFYFIFNKVRAIRAAAKPLLIM